MSENSMEKDWDMRARENAQYYVASIKAPWNEKEFFAKGTKLSHQFCDKFFEKEKFQPKGKRMLDIGCGIGRLERGFSQMFGEVWGLDVSGEMISQAINLNQSIENVKFVKGNGQDLREFSNEYFDFIFSVITFMHIPKKQMILNYLKEINRVLKPGGLCKLQLLESRSGVVFAFGFIPIPRLIFSYIPEIAWTIYGWLALRGNKKLFRGKTWRGTGIDKDEVKQILLDLQFKTVEIEEDIPRVTLWCCGRKY